jgi:hypothetical protein
LATPEYNIDLSKRRIDSIKNYLKSANSGGKSLSNFVDKTFIIQNLSQAVGEAEDITTPKSTEGSFGSSINCRQDIKDKNGNIINTGSQIFSVSAMACRRVVIESVKVVQPPEIKETETTPTSTTKIPKDATKTTDSKSTTSTIAEMKKGLSKKILRQMLSECDYFEMIQENAPMVYDNIREKIKYFNPAFHSMTPEGLNARLTFLNQCVRPGETIPTIGTDNKPRYNDAINTSFGSPPILILRIGDFYNTKIVPNSVAFSYDPLLLDTNPEGIGVQPMLATVTMEFNIIGGMGLARPVEQLQNALSFNYYGNTEIYDERAVFTEDTSALDKEFFQMILNENGGAKPVDNKQQNGGGTTIGEIVTNIPVNNYQTGEITYKAIMDSLLDSTKNYYTNIVNQGESMTKSYNFGVWQLVCKDRLYTKGLFNTDIGDTWDAPIYGKPQKVEEKIDSLFSSIGSDISDNSNFIIDGLINYQFATNVVDKVKTNLNTFLKGFKDDFSLGIMNKINTDLVIPQQEMTTIFNKINLVNTKTDGSISNNKPRVYNISGTTEVDAKSACRENTYCELWSDYQLVGTSLQKFEVYLKTNDVVTDSYNFNGTNNFTPLKKDSPLTVGNKNRFFIALGRYLSDTNNLTNFKNTIISKELSPIKSPSSLVNKFNKIIDDFVDDVKKELSEEDKFFEKIKKSSDYLKYVDQAVYTKGKLRKFNYSTAPIAATDAAQQKAIKELYGTLNSNNDTSVWNGKVKFD